MSDSQSVDSANPYQTPTVDGDPRPADFSIQNQRIQAALRQTRPWALMFGIMGILFTGLMVLIGMGLVAVGVATQGGIGGPNGPPMLLMGIAYGLMGLLYIPPCVFLLRYANRIRDFLAMPTGAALEAALVAQKSFWKFVGVLTLVVFGMYALIFGIAIVFGVLAAAAG